MFFNRVKFSFGALKIIRGKFFSSMSSNLQPPISVRGMKILDKSKFTKEIDVPSIRVQASAVNSIRPLLKNKLLKMEKLRPVQDYEDDRIVLLHPCLVSQWNDLPTQELEAVGIGSEAFIQVPVQLTYENWRADELLKSILPEDQEGLTSFSRIGHIIHLNLRDHLMEYKTLIAEILRDKTSGVRTVVNKAQTIDNTFRNFPLELLIGEPDYQVTTKENGTTFEFDFSTVYWNPRLSMEHERIVNLLKTGDILYDVFAGVGPFAVPAAKRKVEVFANDLNPESYKWLNHNAKRNKVEKFVRTFNKDGRKFIEEDVAPDLLKRLEFSSDAHIHFVMNLPALAVEFLDTFLGLLSSRSEPLELKKPPIVHVYCFVKGEGSKEELALKLVEDNLGFTLKGALQKINFVRNVAPNKDMMRVDFFLTTDILFYDKKTNSKRCTDLHFKQDLKKRKTELDSICDGETLKQETKTAGSQSPSIGQTEKRDESVQIADRHE